MSTLRPRDANWWREECNYISRTTEKRGVVAEMNFKKETFLSYCEMQRDQATKDGFDDAAEFIQSCIDDLTSD